MPAIFEKLDKVKPVYDKVYDVFMFICKVILIADILVTVYSVICRFVPFMNSPSWCEEIILTLMTYMVVLSASLAIRRKAHIRMDVFDHYLPRKLVLSLDLLADIFILILAVVMLVVGWEYASTVGAKGSYVSMPWLSRFWMYAPIPLAGFTMIIFEIESVYNNIKGFWVKEEKK